MGTIGHRPLGNAEATHSCTYRARRSLCEVARSPVESPLHSMRGPLSLLLVLAFALLSGACSTVITPTRPSTTFPDVGQVSGFRFDGERMQLREPGMPLSSSRAWQREVKNYAAAQLNEMLDTPEVARPVETIVTFDLAGPSAIQIGTWKEMTVELTTVLPSGRIVKSEPLTRNIDSPFEYFAVNGMTIAGSALDIAAAIASLVFVFTQDPLACGCFIGALVVGLSLNVGQSVASYFVARAEEGRWSDLFAEALEQHARDIQAALRERPERAPARVPPGREEEGGVGAPPPAPDDERPDEGPPEGEVPPPPPVLDPADEAAGGPAAPF